MNARRYKTDPEILLEQGKKIMRSTEETKYHFRVFAVNMVLSGCQASQIGVMAGVSRVAITSWVKTADEKGFEALKTKKRSGRPAKLSEEQRSTIDDILQNDPQKYGYKVWDGPSLSKFIKDTYDVGIGVRQCQRMFHKLGYSRIRPQTYPSKGFEDTPERSEFKKNEKP